MSRSVTEVCPPFSQAVRLEHGITDWEQYFSSEHFLRSDYYNHIMQPQQIRYMLRACIAINGQTVGLLILQRRSTNRPFSRPFSKADKLLLGRIIPYISNALKPPIRDHGAIGTAWKTGLTLLNPQCQLIGADPVGHQLLLLAGNSKINAATAINKPYPEVPHLLRELCVRSLAMLPVSQQSISVQMQNEWSIFSVSTYNACSRPIIRTGPWRHFELSFASANHPYPIHEKIPIIRQAKGGLPLASGRLLATRYRVKNGNQPT